MKTTITVELQEALAGINLTKQEALARINLTKQELLHSYKLFNLFFKKIQIGEAGLFTYVNLPQHYMDKVFGQSYHRFFNKLKKGGIIETLLNKDGQERYGVNKGIPKSYRIKPELVTDNWITIIIKDKLESITRCTSGVPLSYRCTSEDLPQSLICSSFSEKVETILSSLIINSGKMLEIMNKKLNDFKVDIITIPTEERILLYFPLFKNGIFEKSKAYNSTIILALQMAKKSNKTLIKVKHRYFIVDLEEYITNKKQYIKFSCLRSIVRLENQDYNIDRNTTNNRLDTNITNLAGYLLDVVMDDNDLAQVDLSNSQFAILGHIMTKEYGLIGADVTEFYNQSKNGTLYEYIQKELNIVNRTDAKALMFELFFSKNKDFSFNKEKIRTLFPNVYDFIYKFKEDNEYNQFSIMLQLFESNLFIDEIYYRLLNEDYYALTAHDSIICKTKDVNSIINIILEEFNEKGFEGTLKVKHNKVNKEDCVLV